VGNIPQPQDPGPTANHASFVDAGDWLGSRTTVLRKILNIEGKHDPSLPQSSGGGRLVKLGLVVIGAS